MLNKWLQWSRRNPPPYKDFVVVDVVETGPPTDEVTSHLRRLLTRARLDPGFLQVAAHYLGWSNVEARVTAAAPTTITGRRGEFGEVLSSAMLEQFHEYIIPVQKLRFAVTGGQSLPSTDVVALQLDRQGKIAEVSFVESKLRTGHDTAAAVEGYEQLKADHEQQQPDMLFFVAQRLYERGDALFDIFMSYMRDRGDKSDRDSFHLCLVWEQPAWSETALRNLDENDVELSRLNVHVTLVQNLAELITKSFAALGIVAATDDD